jgi:hypothetical protein
MDPAAPLVDAQSYVFATYCVNFWRDHCYVSSVRTILPLPTYIQFRLASSKRFDSAKRVRALFFGLSKIRPLRPRVTNRVNQLPPSNTTRKVLAKAWSRVDGKFSVGGNDVMPIIGNCPHASKARFRVTMVLQYQRNHGEKLGSA